MKYVIHSLLMKFYTIFFLLTDSYKDRLLIDKQKIYLYLCNCIATYKHTNYIIVFVKQFLYDEDYLIPLLRFPLPTIIVFSVFNIFMLHMININMSLFNL